MEIPGVPATVALGLGLLVQGWRASGLPNWGMYPVSALACTLTVWLWGGDVAFASKAFWQAAVIAWLICLGVNRAASDMARGTTMETKH